MDDRASGPTFALQNIGWIDFETKSETDLRLHGSYRHAVAADAVVLAWALGDGPVTRTAVRRFGETLEWADMPLAFRDHHERVADGEGVWAAYNAGFDKAVWNYSTADFPMLQPPDIIDVMAQATAAGLPPDLYLASRMCGGAVKDKKAGTELIRKFLIPGAVATPQSHPEDWQRLLGYAGDDIEAMRSVFLHTRQLSMAEWREYWAMEAINERGVGIDMDMVRAAAELAATDRVRSNTLIKQLTGDDAATVDTVARLTNFLLDRLPPEGQAILTKREEETDDETGEITKPAKYALTRNRVQRLIAYAQNTFNGDNTIERVLQLRLYGGSKTPAKYGKMIAQQVDGKLFGQYTFNGAGQTGRASSRGVQIHNLARDVLPYEHDAIEALLARDYAAFDALGDTPAARKLSLLIRPSFVPAPGNLFVWSDWSQIEARVLPWLAGDRSRGAVKRLDIFRAVDADPSVPDLYTRTAAELSHVPIDQVTKAMRQRGKVAELALGFMGGVGALQAMGAGYGLHLPDAEAKEIVTRWREANAWAVDFSRALWDTIVEELQRHRDDPKAEVKAVLVGRINVIFAPKILGGSLLLVLPSKRALTYRKIRWDMIDVLDDEDKPTGERRLELMCARGYGRIKLWPGIFVENVTQATAADVLRGTIVRLEDETPDFVRIHTHDEILGEVEEAYANDAKAALREVMQRGFDWSKGLPIMSEETIAPYYTKQEL